VHRDKDFYHGHITEELEDEMCLFPLHSNDIIIIIIIIIIITDRNNKLV